MSSRRQRASHIITEDEINELILKLQPLLPQLNQRQSSRLSASKVLEETCNYIRKLLREVDDLSGKLAQMLESVDADGVDIENLGILLQLSS